MNEQDPREAFVRKLLAQEPGVSEGRYREYRLRLDRKLAAVRPRRRGRWLVAAAALAASVLALLIWRPWRSGTPSGPDAPQDKVARLIVLPYPPDSWLNERPVPPSPYEEALLADLIATATPGEPVQHGGGVVVPLRLDRVLKKPAVERALPSFSCSLGAGGAVRNYLPKGGRVLVYLSRKEEGNWGLLDVRPLDKQSEAGEVAGVERCLQVAGAARSDDPAAAYRRLLAPEAGGLDAVACKVFSCSPDPRAAGPVAECARRLPRGHRNRAYKSLPDLCRAADAPTREAVRKLLIEEVELPDTVAADYIPAVQALGRLADKRAFEVLSRQQRRQPITLLNVHAARALKEASEVLGPAGRDQAREAWLELLCSDSPRRPRPEGGRRSEAERRLIVEVVRLLQASGLSEKQKKAIREIHARRADPWFKQALEPLTK
jgi:hypothetical protein